MRSQKRSRRIVVDGAEYRWRGTGNDGWISIGIWPANNIGPFIYGQFGYHETWIDIGDGSLSSARDQLVITNRIIRRIIEYAKSAWGYDPDMPGKELRLNSLEDVVQWEDAIRGTIK